MQPNQIKVGSCYRTPRNQVRKVVEITSDDRVVFQARNGSHVPSETTWLPGANSNVLPKLFNFSHTVIQEVPCDWDPATGSLTPDPLVAPPTQGPKPPEG